MAWQTSRYRQTYIHTDRQKALRILPLELRVLVWSGSSGTAYFLFIERWLGIQNWRIHGSLKYKSSRTETEKREGSLNAWTEVRVSIIGANKNSVEVIDYYTVCPRVFFLTVTLGNRKTYFRGLKYMRGSRKFCQRGSNLDIVFFS